MTQFRDLPWQMQRTIGKMIESYDIHVARNDGTPFKFSLDIEFTPHEPTQ